MNIKAIIFDFGEVLNAREDSAAVKAMRAQLAARLNLAPTELWAYLFEGEAARQWMTGQLAWDEFWRAVLEPRGINDPVEREAFANEALADSEQLHPDMVALVQQLKEAYKLAILSNASWTEEEMQAMCQNGTGLSSDSFDVVVTSNSAGVTKPNPRIYRLVLDRLGVRPEESIFTDDVADYTAAARQLGIHTHTFITPAGFRKYLREMGVLSRA